jgi:hypothetical protein
MIGFLLASFFLLESFALAAEASSLVTCLAAAAAALKHPGSSLCSTISEKDSEM